MMGPTSRKTNDDRRENHMGVYEKGSVRIRYEEHGSGFPLLMIAGGGLNS
jgi:hypothetical protein